MYPQLSVSGQGENLAARNSRCVPPPASGLSFTILTKTTYIRRSLYFFPHTFAFELLDKPWSQVSSLLPAGSCLQFLSRTILCSAIPLLVDFWLSVTHALLALSASQFVHKKKSHRIYTSMHSAGLELTKLTYTRLECYIHPTTHQPCHAILFY